MRAEVEARGAAASDETLRVLMVLESDFTLRGGGGAESQLRTIARELRRLGHRVAILTPRLSYGPQTTAERCYGLPVGRVAYPRVPMLGAGVMCARLALFLLGHGRRYDAWHVHIGHHFGAVACIVGALLGKPVVLKISGWWELEQGVMAPHRGFLGKLARSWLKQASTVQAISTRIARELERQGFSSRRILVLPNAVDTSRFRAHRIRPAGAAFTAVFVGRLVPEKELVTLLDAWALAFKDRANTRLVLVGDGPLAKPLGEQAERLGIAAQLTFLGHRDRVEDVLAEADVGLLPSRIEGLSNALLEFMAAGLPAIASRVSGSEDFVVPGRNGWLFPVSDIGALAACLREAEALPPARLHEMGAAARKDVEASASLQRVVGRLLSLYRRRPAEPRARGEPHDAPAYAAAL
jgi:glycosyltransferase involved in cell wall biosynthesis